MRRWLFLFAGFTALLISCQSEVSESWQESIPGRTPFLIVPEENRALSDFLEEPYMPLFDDISASAGQVTGDLATYVQGTDIPLLAILLYPDTSNEWQPVWVAGTDNGVVEMLAQQLERPFAQNWYEFNDHTIHVIRISGRTFYVAGLDTYTLISESSLGIEDFLRTRNGMIPALELTEGQLRPGSFIINAPNLERWVEQLVQITLRPGLAGTFEGARPLALSLHGQPADEHLFWRLQGEMPLEEDLSPCTTLFRSPADEMILDRYISTNASAFSIFRLEPRRIPAPEPDGPIGELDQYLDRNSELYSLLSSSLESEVAFAAFAESGFMSSSEVLFLRRLSDPGALRRVMNQLAEEGLVLVEGNSWYLHSRRLGKLLGSDLSPFTSFYLSINGPTLALSRSRGLVETVGADSDRRRTYFYDDDYLTIRNSLPERVSSFTYVQAPEFGNYLQPWLYPQNYIQALTSSLDILTITTARESELEPLKVDFASFAKDETEVPYRERWILPIQSELNGTPLLADISGNNRPDVVFTTVDGGVHAIATDGSTVTEVSTGQDSPVGPPLVYDWYGNNQRVIMQAAGNKIYAWNASGSPLPNFPVILREEITTPLHVADVTRDGVAEMIVATADRQVHILDARGDAISGWPRTANSQIQAPPLLAEVDGQRSIFVFAENGLHSWHVNGQRRSGYPVFIESRFNGSPVAHDNRLLGSAADGNLYAIGTTPLFADSLVTATGDSLITQALNISNSNISHSPAIYNEMIRVDEQLVREDLILLQDDNGAVQIYSSQGHLRFSQSMGQPGSGEVPPLILDIDNNGRSDVLSLAASGRLYSWDLISGTRKFNLPTSGMHYPLVVDLDGDGDMEIITQTREGLRTWTIYQSSNPAISSAGGGESGTGTATGGN